MKYLTLLKRAICYYLYMWVAKDMPLSNAKPNLGQKWLRTTLVKGYNTGKIGHNVNIDKGALVPPMEINIGDNSGVGMNCRLMSHVTIGNNVMMGPYCFFCTKIMNFPIRKHQ